jgi:hypothetical protein
MKEGTIRLLCFWNEDYAIAYQLGRTCLKTTGFTQYEDAFNNSVNKLPEITVSLGKVLIMCSLFHLTSVVLEFPRIDIRVSCAPPTELETAWRNDNEFVYLTSGSG